MLSLYSDTWNKFILGFERKEQHPVFQAHVQLIYLWNDINKETSENLTVLQMNVK